MPNWRTGRAFAMFPTLMACALVPACHQDLGRAGLAAGPTVVIHMTGLLLIVPPKVAAGATNVLVPRATGHAAVLGFGITGNVDGLCLADSAFGAPAKKAGICYVDLRVWSLQPFGGGGNTTPAWKLPSYALNVTDVSGGEHFAKPSASVAQVTFAAGWVGPNPCSLADWTITPVDAAEKPREPLTRPLANVVDWEIVKPTVPKLTFVLRSNTSIRKTVTLPAPDITGRIELILAHIPLDDLQDLPPGPTRPLGNSIPTRAADFDKYYDVLLKPSDSSVPGARRRPLPMNGRQTAVRPCEVRITLAAKGPFPGASKGVGTYACMPATGDNP